MTEPEARSGMAAESEQAGSPWSSRKPRPALSWAFCRQCGGGGWVGARVDHKHPGCGHRCTLCFPPEGYDRTYAIRSACGEGAMDDDNHAAHCLPCNLARWREHSFNERLRRPPSRWRRVLNRWMRFTVLGDPTFLPNREGVVGHVE